MNHILAEILRHKHEEILLLREQVKHYPQDSLNQLLRGQQKRTRLHSLQQCLKNDHLSIIAEIKRRSPSKAHLAKIDDVQNIVQHYLSGHANAISVLTDQKFFSGTLSDLATVSALTAKKPCAVLRKDFIIDPVQIAQAIIYGADAILLIVSATQERTKDLLQFARELNIEVIVEVHTLKELEFALTINPQIIGVNNRNLNDFTVDLQRSLELITYLPKHILKISESGIHTAAHARMLHDAGFDAVLVGEALVQSNHPAQFIQEMRGVA